ncbi:hypothetical protein [Cytobacillus sp. IB215665]|uniref:hypothetical protein n=1 Tax=Cytobacillus sp. IB215665 TaxID=3097357 RepID=UPI002A11263E|nr:hypothetical protein [Cytobacillus sp. IB215665]MDX8367849.1 hypothetical protein [Cytobacillus sp. IB215665]
MEVTTIEFNTPENRKVMRKYLIKLFGKDKAKELMLKNKDNLFGENSLAYALGKRSIEFFCQYFLQDVFVPKESNEAAELADFHFEMWEDLESMFLKDGFDKLLEILPRGSSKSTTCDFALAVWVHCYRYSIYTLVAGKTELDAIQFTAQTRNAFEENPYIINTFGKLLDPTSRKYTVNKLELELTNGTMIQAISSTSSMRGKKYTHKGVGYRPTLVIADDYQSRADILTQEARDKKYRTFMEDVKYVGTRSVYRGKKKIKMATKFVVLGTILHNDCLMSRLAKNPQYKRIIKTGVMVDDIDEYFNTGLWEQFRKILFDKKLDDPVAYADEFYYQHEQDMQFPVLWPSFWSCLELAKDYYEDPVSFKQEMQNDASSIGIKVFHQIHSVPREQIEQKEFVKTILVCDPATGTTAKHDHTALVVGSKAINGFKYARKSKLIKVEFDDYISECIKLIKEYPDITHVWIEKQTYNGADVRELQKQIDADDGLKRRNIEIINEHQSKNKENKIKAIAGKINNGFFVFAKEDEEFTNQILNYAGENFSPDGDDAPDVTAEFDRLIDELNVIQYITLQDKKMLFGGRR